LILPLDAHFSTRLKAALRLWRVLNGRAAGRDPQGLPAHRRARLVLALRALDARLDGASYRELADAIFGPLPVGGEADWATQPVRDRAIRAARLGRELMLGGYRRLLVYPYRYRR
jgi:hypothetical protein